MLKTIDLLLTMMNKAEFCKESGKIVKTIIESPVHCVYINDAIATLFEYMVYDFNGKYSSNEIKKSISNAKYEKKHSIFLPIFCLLQI